MSGIEFNVPYREFRKKVPFLPVREVGSRYALDFDNCTFDRSDLESRAQGEFAKLYRSGGFEARGVKLEAFIEKVLGQLLKEKFPGDANHFVLSKEASIFLIKTSSFFNLDGLLREFHKSGIKKLIELEEALNWTSVLSDYPELREEYPSGPKSLSDTLPGAPAFSMDYEDASLSKSEPKTLQGGGGRFADAREKPTGAVRPKRRFLSEVARTPSFGEDISQEASLFDGSPDSGFYLKAPVGANDADKRALEMYQKARREIDLHFSAGDRVGLASTLSSRIPGSPLEDLVKTQSKSEDDVFSFKTDSSLPEAGSQAGPFVDEAAPHTVDTTDAMPGILDFYGARGALLPKPSPVDENAPGGAGDDIKSDPTFGGFQVGSDGSPVAQESNSAPMEGGALESLFEDSAGPVLSESLDVAAAHSEDSFESTFASFGDSVSPSATELSGAALVEKGSFEPFEHSLPPDTHALQNSGAHSADSSNGGFAFPAFDVAQVDSQSVEAATSTVIEGTDSAQGPISSPSGFDTAENHHAQGHSSFEDFGANLPQAEESSELVESNFLPSPYLDKPDLRNGDAPIEQNKEGQNLSPLESGEDHVVISPSPYGFGVPSFVEAETQIATDADTEAAFEGMSPELRVEDDSEFREDRGEVAFTPFSFESSCVDSPDDLNKDTAINRLGFDEDEPLEGYVLGKKESE